MNFSNLFVLLIFSLTLLWLVSWFSIWSTLENVLCALERNVLLLLSRVLIRCMLSLVLFLDCSSLLYLYWSSASFFNPLLKVEWSLLLNSLFSPQLSTYAQVHLAVSCQSTLSSEGKREKERENNQQNSFSLDCWDAKIGS